MAAGDVEIKLTVNGQDFSDPNSVVLNNIVVENSIFSMLGSGAVCNIIDSTDTIAKMKLNGKEEVELEIKAAGGGSQEKYKYKFQLSKVTGVQDGSREESSGSASGSMHYKQYNLVLRSKEWHTAQGNPVNESYKDKPENVAKKIFKDYLKSDKEFVIDGKSKTSDKRVIIGNKHPIEGLKVIHDVFVPSEGVSPSVLFHSQENGSEKIKFTTWEKLFKESSVVDLIQTNLNSVGTVSDDVKSRSIWGVSSPQLFTKETRQWSQTNYKSVNLDTLEAADSTPKEAQQPQVLGQPVYTKAKDQKQTSTYTVNSPMNNSTKTHEAKGKSDKLSFLSHLAQNEMTFEMPFNPKVKVGKVIGLNFGNKTGMDSGDKEKMFNGKALVTDVTVTVRQLGQSPRCIMKVRCVKAGFDKISGGEG